MAGSDTAVRSRHSAVYWLNNLPEEPTHEQLTHSVIAARVAGLQHLPFGGRYSAHVAADEAGYLVPDDTIVGATTAERLGIRGEEDFLGGVVPHAFVATKAITHPLIGLEATAPQGWSHDFGRRMSGAVLHGATAFSLRDAEVAAGQLLARGPVRLKPVRARAGRGQIVLTKLRDLERAVRDLDADEIAAGGIVMEEHLEGVTTFSVGQVRLPGIVVTYWGTQRLTRDNTGQLVYGGSDLQVVRGGFDALLETDLPAEGRRAIIQARQYDGAAMDCFPGLCASRRNYDVVLGMDGRGQHRCGVLEQSWRIGGATSAEILALEGFREDPTICTIRASSVEVYGESGALPSDAVVFYRGNDDGLGAVTKYARIERFGHT